jgi:hypothetical protein
MQTLASIAALARVLAPPVLSLLNNFTANTEKRIKSSRPVKSGSAAFLSCTIFPDFSARYFGSGF